MSSVVIENTVNQTLRVPFRASQVIGRRDDLATNQPVLEFAPMQTMKISSAQWRAADGPLLKRYLTTGKLKVKGQKSKKMTAKAQDKE